MKKKHRILVKSVKTTKIGAFSLSLKDSFNQDKLPSAQEQLPQALDTEWPHLRTGKWRDGTGTGQGGTENGLGRLGNERRWRPYCI